MTSDDDEMITFFAKAVKVCKTVMPPDCSVFGLVAFLGNAWLLEVKPPAYDCSPEEMMAFLAKVFDGWYVIVAALTLEEGDPDAFKMFALASADRGDLGPLRQKLSWCAEFINYGKSQAGKTRKHVKQQAILEGFNLDYREIKHRAIEAAYIAAQIRTIWKEVYGKFYRGRGLKSGEWFAAASMQIYCVDKGGKVMLDADGYGVPDELAVNAAQKAIAKSTGQQPRSRSPLDGGLLGL